MRQIVNLLDDLQNGKAPPRFPGPIGTFFRQYAGASERAMSQFDIDGSPATSISGRELGRIHISPITAMDFSLPNALMGGIGTLLVACESWGTVLRIDLWSSARNANELARVWRRDPKASLELSGTYRWFPPGRITPGEASIEVAERSVAWTDIRCLKFSGEDIGRPPDAASFQVDASGGQLGVKAYRTFVVRYVEGRWICAPGMDGRCPEVQLSFDGASPPREEPNLLVLAWSEPWELSRWNVRSFVPVSDDDALAHTVTWGDYVKEMAREPPITASEVQQLAMSLRENGYGAGSVEWALEKSVLDRRVDTDALQIASWLRGST